MICTGCGNEVADNDKFCGECGRSIQDAPRSGNAEPGPANNRFQVPLSTGSPPQVIVPNHLVWAILVTLFCCLPTGIVAIVYSAQVNGALENGDIQRARRLSENAKLWIWISFGIGIAVIFLFGVLPLLGLFTLDLY